MGIHGEKRCSSQHVDILLAAYNGEKYIKEQIESIRYQTHDDWRLLISDDGSTDGTVDIARSYAAKDSRIVYIDNPNKGRGSKDNFLFLLQNAGDSYVMFSDQDDVWLPDKIEKTLAKMEETEKNGKGDIPLLVFTDLIVVDNQLEPIAASFEDLANHNPRRTSLFQLTAQNVACGCTMLMNKELLMLCRKACLDDTHDIMYHDWLAILVAAAFGKVRYLDEATMLYRQHRDNLVGVTHRSLKERYKNQETAQEIYTDSIRQALVFLNIYRDMLSKEQKRRLFAYASILDETSPARGLLLLLESGCWRYKSRKLTQLIMIRRHILGNKKRYDKDNDTGRSAERHHGQ